MLNYFPSFSYSNRDCNCLY